MPKKGEMVECGNCHKFTGTITAIVHFDCSCRSCHAPLEFNSAHGWHYHEHLMGTERRAELDGLEVLYVEFRSARIAKRVLCLFQTKPGVFPLPIAEIRTNHASHCLEYVALPGQSSKICAMQIGKKTLGVTRITINNSPLWQSAEERKAA